MTRIVLIAMALVALPVHVPAGEAVIRVSVQPAPAPRPALKYQLLPELRELNPGNPAHYYLRLFAEQRNFFFTKEAAADRARYLSMPLAELAKEKLPQQYGGSALAQADWGARLDTIDWQLLHRVQANGLEVLTPELGRMGLLASALKVRFRIEVAGRRFDDAIRSAKTMFALARHLGEYPTEAASLLGISVADQALSTLEEMMQQPGCPNLYWALTDLPCPLVDLRKGLQGDRALLAADLRLLRDDAPMSEEQLQKFVGHISGEFGFAREQAGQPPRDLRAELAARWKDADGIRSAQGRLVEAGCSRDLLRKFPPLQVILLDEKRDYELRRDEAMKLLALPPWQIDALSDREAVQNLGDGLFADMVPHVISSRRVQGRLEQRIGLLRHIEALRLFAAEHGGKLPDKLTDVEVPLPQDPFTGKPFAYTVDAQVVRLAGGAPRGEEQNPCFHACYEVTLQK
jgi:hypothetical protein